MKEIRWHARAGQGAKTASHLLAVALLEAGRSVQAFPEYGPERRGAPVRAFDRVDDKPIRRHDSVDEADAVVVLDASLLREDGVREGLKPNGFLLVYSDEHVPGAICVPTTLGPRVANLVMLGAVSAVLGEPSLESLARAADEVLSGKVAPDTVRAAIGAGHAAASEETSCAA